ncbi:MAG TPA: MbtH family NRPS accessory protein [Rhodoferax sp.]|nr:MbtH family NRPS accessory protein [Rhodoferax sp.]
MQADEGNHGEKFDAVINEAPQSSMWLADKEVPAWWQKNGVTGSRAHCLEQISVIWTEMRPMPVRRQRDDFVFTAKNGCGTHSPNSTDVLPS